MLDGVEVMSPSFPYAPLNPHPPQKISTPDGYIYIFLLLWIFRFYNTVNCSVILSVNLSPIRGMSGLNVAFLTHCQSLLETGCRIPSKFPEEMIEDLTSESSMVAVVLSVQASQVLPHQAGKTISLWTWLEAGKGQTQTTD